MKLLYLLTIVAFLASCGGGGGGGGVSMTLPSEEMQAAAVQESIRQVQSSLSTLSNLDISSASTREEIADINAEISALSALDTATIIAELVALQEQLSALQIRVNNLITTLTTTKTCQNGNTIPESETCMKSCINGDTIPESETCMKSCINGETIPESDICMKSCINGDTIPESDTCMKSCINGDTIPESDICMKSCINGETIPESETCMKSCINGETIPESDTCMKSCINGETIPESDTCMKSCINGDTIPESDTCMKSCINGETIPESDICMQTCPVVGTIAETESCPATQICNNGEIILASDICMKRCNNGDTIPESDICMQTCPVVGAIPETESCPATQICNNGEIILASDICMKRCNNGDTIPESDTCMKSCINGDTIPESDICIKSCINGETIPESDICMQTCPVVGAVPETESCPATQICNNGEIILASATCMKSCINGDTIPESHLCMQTCPVVGSIPEIQPCPATQICLSGDLILASATCMKSCINGDTIPESDVCMQTCPVVGSIPEIQPCPATQTCLSGDLILASDTCMRTCNGETKPENEVCYNDDGSFHSVILPPPNPSDGLNYRTAEFRRSYGLDHINADAAYQRGYFGQGVTVAVLDSGMLTSHVDLRNNVVAGYDFIDDTETITDPNGHGTLVGGIIAATKNGIGGHGVAPQAKMMPLRILNEDGSTETFNDILDAIRHALDRNVPIINNSYGGSRQIEGVINGISVFIDLPVLLIDTGRVQDFSNIIGDKDTVLVWASGNEHWNSRARPPIYADKDRENRSPIDGQYTTADIIEKFTFTGVLESVGNLRHPFINAFPSAPSSYPQYPLIDPTLGDQWLVAVASNETLDTSKNDNRLASFSNGCGRTSFWCLTVPGENIYTTHSDMSGNFYARVSGTSFAAPYVSGALAVLKNRLPNMPMSVIRAILLTTATDINNDGIDIDFGWGLVNLEKAVTLQNLSAFATTKTCLDGSTIPVTNICPSITCADGEICYYADGSFTSFSLALSPPNLADNTNYRAGGRNTEFNANPGLGQINADAAYQRGYFGQGVTVAVVDSGMLTSHMDLSANIVAGYNFADNNTIIHDGVGHGTWTGGIIAAVRGNTDFIYTSGTYGTFTGGTQGVAPQAKLMPLQVGDANGNFVPSAPAFEYAITNHVPIINNSYGRSFGFVHGQYNGVSVFFRMPLLRELWDDDDRTILADVANAVRGHETVLVWSAGNDGWHNNAATLQIYSDVGLQTLSTLGVSKEDFIENVILDNRIALPTTNRRLADYNIPLVGPGLYALAPTEYPELVSQWLVAVAATPDADDNIRLLESSNGCGEAKFWCLAAPGYDIATTSAAADSILSISDGTSVAAPHVSGALAVLKSRLPNMPMSVIRALLLNTATDINDDGVDEDFGWGFINLEKAVTLQNLSTIAPTNNSGNSGNGAALIDTNIKLPAALSHVKSAMQHISVAVSVVGNAHYNMPLAHIARIGTQNHERFGDAAADMLRTANDNRFSAAQLFAATDYKTNQFRTIGATVDLQHFGKWQLQHDFCKECKTSAWQEWNEFHTHTDVNTPFFAADEKHYKLNMQGKGIRPFAAIGGADNTPYYQLGLRWKNNLSGMNILAEYSEIREPESFMGADFGTLGYARAKTRQKRIMLSGDLFADWQGFAMLEHAQSAADISDGGFLQSVADLRAWGWTAALQTENLFIGDDKLRLSVRQQTALQSGRALLNYTRATCDDGGAGDCFSEAFYGDLQEAPDYLRARGQTLVAESTAIELSESPTTIFTLGYAVHPSAKSSLAFGLEHNTKTKENALSAQLNIQF